VARPPERAAGPTAAVLRLQRAAGNRAVGAVLARIARNPQAEIEAAEAELQGAKEVAEDFLEQLGEGATKTGPGIGRSSGRRTTGQLIERLRQIARRRGGNAQEASRVADALQNARRKIADLHRSRGTTGVPGRGRHHNRFDAAKAEDSAAKAEEAAAKAEHAAGKGGQGATKAEKSLEKASAKAESAAAKSTLKTETAATQAIVKAEETAIKAEAKLGTRVAAGAGRLGLALLLPGPEDAIIMMVQFAGSYEDAWEAIEQRNTRDGVAFGIAAGMMDLDWEWVTNNLWRRFPVRDLETQMLGAVGKAEHAFNSGLARGHKYGAGHPHRMKYRILVEVFSGLASVGAAPDEEDLYTIETVGRVARALMPLADDFLRKAAERKEAREKREAAQVAKELKESGCVGFKC